MRPRLLLWCVGQSPRVSICGIPPLRQKKGARMGHGSFVVVSASKSRSFAALRMTRNSEGEDVQDDKTGCGFFHHFRSGSLKQ